MKHEFPAMVVFLAAASCSQQNPSLPAIERLVVDKAAREMSLFSAGQPVRSYRISLGANPTGHKQQEGDQRTPEGVYEIEARKADSSFYRALRISYPNENDRARAAEAGVDPGGLIMIHGIRNGFGWVGALHRLADWTDGCIAVTNGEMDEIWASVEIGTPVEILP